MRSEAGHAPAHFPAASRLIAFYRGGHDDRGRTLDQILEADDTWLEGTHDYIQWVFPLPERSSFNPRAPLLTARDIEAFGQDTQLQRRLAAMAGRMLEFYGLAVDRAADTPVVTHGPHFSERADEWIVPGDHNFLRLSRILRSLALLGHQPLASAILAALEAIAQGEAKRAIGATTLNYWRQAAASSYI